MPLATYSDAFKEYARNYGMDHPEQAWICTPWDTWEANPFYAGPPVPHPESYDFEDVAGPFTPAPMTEDDIPF